MNLLSVGISKYESLNDSIASDNDAKIIYQKFKELFPKDIIDDNFLLTEEVNNQQFRNALLTFNAFNTQNKRELVVFYFSGHAKNYNDTLWLVFSDGSEISVNEILDFLKQNKYERILLIFDCCYAGSVTIEQQNELAEQNLNSLNRNGVDIFCACSAEKEAYPENNNNNGVFTKIFIDSISVLSRNKIKGVSIKGLVSMIQLLFDNRKLSLPYSQTFNYIYSSIVDYYLANPIVSTYKPTEFNYSTDYYELIEVKSAHHSRNKRYSIFILLKVEPSDKNITLIMEDIKKMAPKFNVYKNQIQEDRLKHTAVSHLFVCFALNKLDISNNNYYCQVFWVDENSNRKNFYSNKGGYFHSDNFIVQNSSYFSLQRFILANTVNDKEIFERTKPLRVQLINVGTDILEVYNQRTNGTLTKSAFYKRIEDIINNSEYYVLDTQLVDTPLLNEYTHLKGWIMVLLELNAIISDIILYHTSDHFKKMKEKDIKIIMKQRIEDYYKSLEELLKIENHLSIVGYQ